VEYRFRQDTNENGINPYQLFIRLIVENIRIDEGGLTRPNGGGVN